VWRRKHPGSGTGLGTGFDYLKSAIHCLSKVLSNQVGIELYRLSKNLLCQRLTTDIYCFSVTF